LIFIEVALTAGLTADVGPLLDPQGPVLNPEKANTAIFYSITNCQEGLRGISFGDLLIKRVVEDLGKTLPRIQMYSTLSPIPGFRDWLDSTAGTKEPALQPLLEAAALWNGSADTLPNASVQAELMRLCAVYLVKAKKGRLPLDSVARFHLSNGARLERLNWGGDVSKAGLARSYGFTANYLYRLAEVERNHESFATENAVVASRKIVRLAERSPSRLG
jgi:malonyl-CoA decarboxylase